MTRSAARGAAIVAWLCAAFASAAPAPRVLEPGLAVEAEMGGSERPVYSVRLSAGQFASVVVEQRGIDVVVVLTEPDGKQRLHADGLTGAWGTESISVLGPPYGDYGIALEVLDPKAVRGRYRIRLAELRPAVPEDRKRAAAEKLTAEAIGLGWAGGSASLAKAVAGFERALQLWREVGDREAAAVTLYDLAWAARLAGNNRQSLERSHQTLAAARLAGDRQLEAKVLGDIGLVKNLLGDPAGAAEVLEQSVALARSVGDIQTENESSNKLGWAASLLGRYQRAIEVYGKAIALARSRQDRLSEGWPTNGLALVYARIGETQKALATYQRSLALWRDLANKRAEVLTLQDIGFLYWSAGEPRLALRIYEETLPVARAMAERRGEALALNNIGLAESSLGQLDRAREHLSAALPIWRAMGDRPGEIQTLHNLGRVEAELGRPEAAVARWSEDLSLARRFGDPRGEAQALAALARLEGERGRLEEARSHAEASIAILEAQRRDLAERGLRSSFLSAHQDAFAILVDVLLKMHERRPGSGFDAEAFAVTERGRARSFLEALQALPGSAAAAGPAGMPTTELATVERLRPHLRPDTALLSFWLGSDRVFAFLVTQGGFEIVRLALSPAELSERVGVFVDLVARGSPHAGDVVGSRLYADVVAPCRRRLPPAIRRLVLVPDRALHSLPFEALGVPGGRRLLEDFVVSYAPSASVFVALATSPSSSERSADVLALASPLRPAGRGRETVTAFDGERFELEPLLHTGREAREAVEFGSGGSRLLAGAEATDAWFQAADLGRFRVIHLATHGLLSQRSPQRSALLLASRRGGDGLLEAREIYDLRLRSDLVVLSACQSARGRVLPGEGVEGLARAFFQAGARTVVASLWNVNDERAAELMASFYRHLARGDGKAEALRAAKLDMLRREPTLAPRYWATFVLLGEPSGTIPLRSPSLWRRLTASLSRPSSGR